MIRSKRLLAAGFATALGIAGVGFGSSSITASSGGGGVCEGIDLAALGAGTAPDGTDAMAEGTDAMAEGTDAMAEGTDAMAEGTDAMAEGTDAMAEGTDAMAEGTDAMAEGTAAPGTEAAGTEPAGSEPAGSAAAGGDGATVALMFDVTGRGDKSFNDAAAAGLDRAVADFGIVPTESPPQSADDRAERVAAAAEDGNQLVIATGFLWTDTVTQASAAYPDTHFLLIDSVVEADNVANIVFAEEQGSFLVGVAAGLQSESGELGFVGGVDNELIQKFEAGFVAGAQCVNPDANVRVEYISDDPAIGFNDPARGREIAAAMYEDGAEIVYGAAGASTPGVLEATAAAGEAGEVWTVGVDSDLYQQVDADLQPYVLTSMIKRVDNAVYNTIEKEVNGEFTPGLENYDLSVEGVGYSTSGGFVDAYVPTIEALKAMIIDGTIVVPVAPEG